MFSVVCCVLCVVCCVLVVPEILNFVSPHPAPLGIFLRRMGTLARHSYSGKSAQATVHRMFARKIVSEMLNFVAPHPPVWDGEVTEFFG